MIALIMGVAPRSVLRRVGRRGPRRRFPAQPVESRAQVRFRVEQELPRDHDVLAGLQALELVKLVKQVKKADHRNAFLNLAVPIMQASEPGDVMKTKVTDVIETSLWDRWEVEATGLSLKEVIARVEEMYPGLQVRDVMRGNSPIYFHAIMDAPGKENEKEKDRKVIENQ